MPGDDDGVTILPCSNPYHADYGEHPHYDSSGTYLYYQKVGRRFAGYSSAVSDPVNHPPHYTTHPSGIECIEITEWYNFNIGNAIKYLWRSDQKGGLEDLCKAQWYITREIERIQKAKVTDPHATSSNIPGS